MKLTNLKFYDIGDHPAGFNGYRVYFADEKKSYYFSIKQLGKREAKRLAEKKALESPTAHHVKVKPAWSNRRMVETLLPAGINVSVTVETSDYEVWRTRPYFITHHYKNKRLYEKKISIKKHGYDNAWTYAVRDFCKRRNIPKEFDNLLTLRPDPSVFIQYLKKYKRKNPEVQIDWETFKSYFI